MILAESVVSPFFHSMALANLNSGQLLVSLKGDAMLKGKKKSSFFENIFLLKVFRNEPQGNNILN